MVPIPMISSPFSAWTLRIENISSCLRRVDAPSMPSSSAMLTRSAGEFFFSSLRCMEISRKIGMVVRSRGRIGNGGWMPAREAGERRVWRYAPLPNKSIGAASYSLAATSEGSDDHQHDDQHHRQARYLVHDPERLAADRPLAPRELAAVANHPAMIAREGDHEQELELEPVPDPGLGDPGEGQAENPDEDHR